jgi:hypothetical protein
MDADAVRRNVRYCVTYLRDLQKLGASSQQQHDQMLIWSIGLMGAGCVAAYGHLQDRSRSLALAPWLIGILVAIVARIVGRALWDRDGELSFKKIQGLLSFLLEPPGNAADVVIKARAVIRDEAEFQRPRQAVNRLKWWTERLSQAAHALFAAGVVTIFWALA